MHSKTIYILSLILISISSCKKSSIDIEKKYEVGVSMYLRQDTSSALKIFEEILNERPDFAKARIMIGKIHYYNHEIKKAEADFSESLSKNPDSIDARFWLGKTRSLDPEMKTKALKDFDDVLERDSRHLEAMYYKALIFEGQGKLAEAMGLYRQIVRSSGVVAMAHAHLGSFYKKSGLPEEAKKEFDLAKKLTAGDPDLQNELLLFEVNSVQK